jgi:hypothetical protein
MVISSSARGMKNRVDSDVSIEDVAGTVKTFIQKGKALTERSSTSTSLEHAARTMCAVANCSFGQRVVRGSHCKGWVSDCRYPYQG